MTTEEFEPIGYFMGWIKQPSELDECWSFWLDTSSGERRSRGYVADKTSLTPAECYEALNRLVEKGYFYELYAATEDRHGLDVSRDEWRDHNNFPDMHEDPSTAKGLAPTIHEAIEQALLQLIAAERGKER